MAWASATQHRQILIEDVCQSTCELESFPLDANGDHQEEQQRHNLERRSSAHKRHAICCSMATIAGAFASLVIISAFSAQQVARYDEHVRSSGNVMAKFVGKAMPRSSILGSMTYSNGMPQTISANSGIGVPQNMDVPALPSVMTSGTAMPRTMFLTTPTEEVANSNNERFEIGAEPQRMPSFLERTHKKRTPREAREQNEYTFHIRSVRNPQAGPKLSFAGFGMGMVMGMITSTGLTFLLRFFLKLAMKQWNTTCRCATMIGERSPQDSEPPLFAHQGQTIQFNSTTQALPHLGGNAIHLGSYPPHVARCTPLRMQEETPSTSVDDAGDGTGATGMILKQDLRVEMRESYVGYAMSVIMSRALPDIRDGLKPVHRRILYAMDQLKLNPQGPHRKCARVVGEVLGKYHPHGDSSVYDALVRMAQDFSMRVPLIDGHGNFGSIDPDPAAAMRYTECKLQRFAVDALLADVQEDMVDFVDNFDGSELEPSVLPAKLPMMLLNGVTGIAVGMATNIPPHNLAEIVDALQALIKDPGLPDAELFKIVPAPDFPTGGIVMGTQGAMKMYSTGKGSVTLRASAHVEAAARANKRDMIVVTELPYGIQKNAMLERIANLVNEKKLEGIAEIRDESSIKGMRIIFEVKRGSEPLKVLNNLYKQSTLQTTFAGNLMAVAGGRLPEQFTLRSALLAFLDFRIECLLRRCRHRMRKAEERLHLVNGLLIAQTRMEDVIKVIRAANDTSEARAELQSQFGLSEKQSEAILSMQLRRLTALERGVLENEEKELNMQIAELSLLISDRAKLLELISKELAELKDAYGTPRRTKIGLSSDAELNDLDLTPNDPCTIIRTAQGYLKRLALSEFEAQQRGTKGKMGMSNLREDDAVVQIISCQAHDTILYISKSGIAYALRAFQIPLSSRTSRGVLAQQLLPIGSNEEIMTAVPVQDFSESTCLVMLTCNGWIKKTPLKVFERITARGLRTISLTEGDALIGARLCTSEDSVLICSEGGQAVRFNTAEEQLRSSRRQSRGVKSMRMKENDRIAGFVVLGNAAESGSSEKWIVAVTCNGSGKIMPTDAFKAQKRGGVGLIAMKFKDSSDKLKAVLPFEMSGPESGDEPELMLITAKGTVVRQRLRGIASQGRSAKGVRIQKLDDDDSVASATIVGCTPDGDCQIPLDGHVAADNH